MNLPRILWMSDSPVLTTGFGRVTREVLGRLARMNRFEVACLGWFGPDRHEERGTPYPLFAGGEQYGQDTFPIVASEFKPDIVVSCGDLWMMEWQAQQDERDFSWIGYFTVDGEPLPAKWLSSVALQSSTCPQE